LYWFKEGDKEQYPVNRIKFEPGSNIQLKREDDLHLKIQTARKFYILRGEKKNIDEWYDLFKKSLKETPESLNGSPRVGNSSKQLDENGEDNDTLEYLKCHVYEFSYGFLRDVIYEQTLHAQRQQLHIQANKYIEQALSKSYDSNLAFLQGRHQELGSDANRKNEESFVSHNKLKKKRQSTAATVYVQDTAPRQTKNFIRE